MICYKDKTFCRGDGCQAFKGCHRALTQEVKDGAEKTGIPVAQWETPVNWIAMRLLMRNKKWEHTQH